MVDCSNRKIRFFDFSFQKISFAEKVAPNIFETICERNFLKKSKMCLGDQDLLKIKNGCGFKTAKFEFLILHFRKFFSRKKLLQIYLK